MPLAEPNDFFKEKRSFSATKQEIFGKYFNVWCQTCQGKINTLTEAGAVFIDMQAGDELAEKSESETDYTLQQQLYKSILKRPVLNARLQTFYYNKNKELLGKTNETIEALPLIQELQHPPIPLENAENRTALNELLDAGYTSLNFLDPFQSRQAQHLLQQALSNYKSDLVMLLHPESITKAVSGKSTSKPLTEVFGEHLQPINSYCKKERDMLKRQEFILNHFTAALQEKAYFTLLFKINLPDTEQPEHYLLFASPDAQNYRNFKEIILPYSTYQEDGVPVFIANEFKQLQTTLFEQTPEFTISNLVAHMENQAGVYKYKSIEKIYETDSLNTNYSRDNYLTAFEQLQKAGKVEFLNASTRQTIRRPTLTSIVKYK